MLRTVSLPDNPTLGKLYLCPMPGRFEPMDVFLAAIGSYGVDHVVCLVSDGEIASKSPDYLAALQQQEIPARLWRHDIPDYGIPEDPDGLDRMLDLLWERLDNGESMVIHCAGGHGRTGMVAILLLARMGLDLEQAFETARRAGSAPDTPEQRKFVEERIAGLRRCD